MNQTQNDPEHDAPSAPPPPGESTGGPDSSEFDPRRVRSIFEMKRSREDRMVAGVCSGAARYLNIDPVVIRVVIGALTFVGLAGVIVYVAAWILLPEEDTGRSIAQEHLGVGDNEEQVRTVGLIIAGIVALVSGFGLFGGGGLDTPFPYLGLFALGVFWLFVIRPRNRRQAAARPAGYVLGQDGIGAPAPGPAGPGESGFTPPAPPYATRRPNPRHDSGALTLFSLLVSLVAVGVMWIYSATVESIPFSYFPATVLGVIGLGMVIGTFFGNGRPLILPGFLAAAVLAVSVLLPAGSIGQRAPTPTSAAAVDSSYRLGVGDLALDLTEVTDLDQLDGRTIRIKQGFGAVSVDVPDGLDVDVEADSRGGRITAFDQTSDGDNPSVSYTDPVDDGPNIRLVITQTAGEIEVNRR